MLGFTGHNELLIILAIVLIVFGGKKIPELMGGLGKGVKNFKKGLADADASDEKETEKLEDKSGSKS